jgi:hypothetical protein
LVFCDGEFKIAVDTYIGVLQSSSGNSARSIECGDVFTLSGAEGLPLFLFALPLAMALDLRKHALWNQYLATYKFRNSFLLISL